MSSDAFTLWGETRCVNPNHGHDVLYPSGCYCTDGRVWVPIERGTRRYCVRGRELRAGGSYWLDLMVLPTGERPDRRVMATGHAS